MTARSRLASLWVSQTARSLADYCLRMFIVLRIAATSDTLRGGAWHQTTVFYLFPFIVLTPLHGAVSNSLPKRWVLFGSSAFCVAVTALAGLLLGSATDPWNWCVALAVVATGHAVYSPTRYALLPAAATDCGVPLGRVMGWIETGGAAAIVLGTVLGWKLTGDATAPGFPPAVLAALGLNLLALLTSLPVHFPSDLRRPEPPVEAVKGFFRDTGRIFRDRLAAGTLAGLALFMALIMTGSGAVVAYTLTPEFAGQAVLPRAFALLSVGVAAGSLLASLQGHLRRALGLVPLGVAGMLAALAWTALAHDLDGPSLLLGLTGGLINVPLRAGYQAAVPADARGNGMAVMNTANYVCIILLSGLLFGLSGAGLVTPAGQLGVLAAVGGTAGLVAGRIVLRECVEQVVEILLWPCYKVRVHGPGPARLPAQGPFIVIGNHAAWLDPLWIGKVVPQRLTPMMTSKYFDKPVLHWLMTRVVQAIRVPDARFRREAPEIDDAVRALDRGTCLLIFPEGAVRRREDQPLRRFGQGIWHILRQRPQTPVVVCWIEGGWGSFTSYRGGPPLRKPLDWRRPIDLGFEAPQVLDPALLGDQHATRRYLMQACANARRLIGLETPDLSAWEHAKDESAEADEPVS